MWGSKNTPEPPPEPIVAGFSGFDDDGAQREVDEAARPDETLEPPGAVEAEPERQPAPVYALIRYDVTDQRIEELRKEYAGLAERTPDNYEPRRKAIATCRELRVAVERKRKELKADSLEWGRKVDAVAKRFTALLEAIENPLQLAKDADDEEKRKAREAREAAEKAELEAKVRAEQEAAEAERRAKIEAEEAARRAEREAEEQRLAAERAELERQREALAAQQREAEAARKAEQERRDAEEAARRAELDREAERLKAEREAAAEAARVEQERIAAERRALAEERERLERAERERKIAEEAAQAAKEQAEAERIAAEEARVREQERKADLARRLEALKPDAEKVAAFAASIRLWMNGITPPEVESNVAANAIRHGILSIERIADEIEADFERESRFAAEDALLPQEAT